MLWDLERRGGEPLPHHHRRPLEASLGTSLDHVRVHTDAGAQLGDARAAAYGPHLLLRSEDVRSTGLDARAVVAHEVAHALQQRTDGPSVSEAAAEADAHRVAAGVVSGQRVAPAQPTGLRLARCPPTTERDRQHGEQQIALLYGKEARIRSASAATGEFGVTPKMIAAVLFVEMFFRNDTSGMMGDMFGSDPSLGWGQMRTSTALMATGAIPLQQASAATAEARRAAGSRVEAAYAGVSEADRAAMRARLETPDSAIDLVAQWLARLKNRPNRYPRMRTRAFGSDARAVKIIATEYNLGPTATPEADARSSDYGDGVWQAMTNARFDRFAM